MGDLPSAEPWDIGRPVRGYRWRARDARGSLLLQHGFAEHSDRYVTHCARIVPRLVERGIDVHAIDMRGHGRSPGPRGVVDVELAVRDHQAARHRLRQARRPLFLFGHSLGGLVTAAGVARDQAGVDGVVLSGPALLFGAGMAARLFVTALAAVAPARGFLTPQSAEGLSRDARYLEDLAADPTMFRGRLPNKVAATTLAVTADAWPRYRDWQVPVMVFHGRDDSYTDPQGSVRFIDTVPARDKRLHLLDAGRHEALNDLDNDRVAALMLDWIEERLHAGG